MTPDNTLQDLLSQLRLPQTDLDQLSFCHSNRAARVAAWANQLPATRINHTSVLLYQALPEVCRLDTGAANRLEMLECLRPYVQQCILGLSQSFLGKPLILPDNAQKTAVIAQALQKHMSNGYCRVIKQLVEKNRSLKDEARQRVSLALHRAITGMGLQLLRNSQIYTQVSNQLWLELNNLYFLADKLELLKDSHPDPLLTGPRRHSIEQAYCRSLLLACANPNQLRQLDVNHLYEALEDWVRLVRLTPLTTDNSNLFVIDLAGDRAPAYKSQIAAQPASDNLRELNLSALLNSLEYSHKQGSGDQDSISIPNCISDNLLAHTLKAWREEHRRHQPRKRSQDMMEVAVGLRSIHYHLADKLNFDQFLQQTCQLGAAATDPFNAAGMPSDYDSWSNLPLSQVSEDGVDASSPQPHSSDDKYPLFSVQIADISPTGYGLNWRQDIPAQATTGEMIALREPHRRQWSLGVIRWVRQHRGASQLGIQLIAQNAHAIAIQQLQKSGIDNVQMRGLISRKAGSQLNSEALITANFPFRIHNKVRFNQAGVSTTAQLSQLLQSTSSINVFSYRALDNSPQHDDSSPPADDYADNW